MWRLVARSTYAGQPFGFGQVPGMAADVWLTQSLLSNVLGWAGVA
jgi:hypothetical protein